MTRLRNWMNARRARAVFDRRWYSRQYGVPENEAWRDYLAFGELNGRHPNAWFDPEQYLRFNADVSSAGLSPLLHFVVFGQAEGRPIGSVGASNVDTEPLEARPSLETVRRRRRAKSRDPRGLARALFSAQFYRSLYDVTEGGGSDDDLFDQYFGQPNYWNRRPNAWFDGAQYLDLYPDVRAAQVNPFFHYVAAGQAEGRLPRHPGGEAFRRSMQLSTFDEELQHWDVPGVVIASDRSQSRDQIELLLSSNRQTLLSIGNDNFLQGTGGIQLVLGHELSDAAAGEINHLYLFPAAPSGMVGSRMPVTRTMVNGALGPSIRNDELRSLLAELGAQGVLRVSKARIHGLLGWDPWLVAEIVRPYSDPELVVHDMSTVCTNYTLTLDGHTPCGAPPISSSACGICRFGPSRRRMLEDVGAMLDSIELHLVFPSEIAQLMWNRQWGAPKTESVRPHGCVVLDGIRPPSSARRVRLAYVGLRSGAKGFDLFREISEWNIQHQAYECFHFGADLIELPGVRSVKVNQVGDYSNTMTDALIEKAIDLVLVSPTGFETYSFVAHEAIAAGCRVVTHAEAGNVARLVREEGAGYVLPSQAEVITFLTDLRVIGAELATRREQRAGRYQFDLERSQGDQ